jgi:phosphoserine phosphatase
MINPVADLVQIPRHRIYANNLLFHHDGSYKGFDPEEPTCRDGGKQRVIQQLIDYHGYKSVIMIGDGATDMQVTLHLKSHKKLDHLTNSILYYLKIRRLDLLPPYL